MNEFQEAGISGALLDTDYHRSYSIFRQQTCRFSWRFVLGNHWLKPSTLARHDDNYMSCLTLGGPCKKHSAALKANRENLGGASRREEMTNLPESLVLESILAERYAWRLEGPWVRPNTGWAREVARDNLETNPIPIKPETESHMAEQFFWVSLPWCSLPRHSFPIKSFALSILVSPWTIHFQVLDNSPFSDPGRVSLPATLHPFSKSHLHYIIQAWALSLQQLYLLNKILSTDVCEVHTSLINWRGRSYGSISRSYGLWINIFIWVLVLLIPNYATLGKSFFLSKLCFSHIGKYSLFRYHENWMIEFIHPLTNIFKLMDCHQCWIKCLLNPYPI